MDSSVAPTRPADGLLRIAVEELSSGTVVVADGELDLATAPQLERRLGELSGRLVLDLRRLDFIDSTGLRLLLRTEERSRRDGLDLRLAPGPAAQRLIELTGLSGHFAYVDAEVLTDS